MTVLAAIALPISAALLGATMVGHRERGSQGGEAMSPRSLRDRGWHAARLIVVIVGCALMLVEPALLSPWWLQYGLLLVLPFILGMIGMTILAPRWTEPGGESDSA